MGRALFTDMITRLYQYGEIVLYNNVLNILTDEALVTSEFLREVYDWEKKNYPFIPPDFDWTAALWSAKVVYFSAQLLLYREDTIEEVETLLRPYTEKPSAVNILSVDICLRFLPDILSKIKQVDPDDEIIPILESFLKEWHYSSINYSLEETNFDFDPIVSNDCLRQLYCDRIIANKDFKRGQHEVIAPFVLASLGNYKNIFWKEFKTIL
jgi:hypothetical protein